MVIIRFTERRCNKFFYFHFNFFLLRLFASLSGVILGRRFRGEQYTFCRVKNLGQPAGLHSQPVSLGCISPGIAGGERPDPSP